MEFFSRIHPEITHCNGIVNGSETAIPHFQSVIHLNIDIREVAQQEHERLSFLIVQNIQYDPGQNNALLLMESGE
jgi:hypothetical protein